MTVAPEEPSTDLLNGKYYRGRIVKLHRGSGRGRIRSFATGRDIPFVFQFVTMVGLRQRLEDLREGLEVGYDVSWTSRGLRVSLMRIPDPPATVSN